jgi:16S rRNA (cytidine1402-2'-O)-methyltransferase
MLFHEAPHKLRTTLDDLAAAFGPDRPVALCRELTKLHEQTLRTTLGGAAEYYRENEPRGEYVLVVAGAEAPEPSALTLEDGVGLVLHAREQGEKLKDAVRRVAADTGLSRNELYAAALAAQREDP